MRVYKKSGRPANITIEIIFHSINTLLLGSAYTTKAKMNVQIAAAALLLCLSFALIEAKNNRKYLKWLHRAGYYTGNVNNLDSWSDDEVREAMRGPLRQMKNFYGIGDDDELDEVTEETMDEPRCNNKDVGKDVYEEDDNNWFRSASVFNRFKRYTNLGESTWSDLPVTIGFRNYSKSLSKEDQEYVAIECAKKWAEVSGLSFRFVRDEIPNIHIGYNYFVDEDGNIEGQFGVIGRALSPVPFRNPPTSWITMDKSEIWRINQLDRRSDGQPSTSLMEGLCHEIGHSLGLGHSGLQEAIMYPSVGRRQYNTRLAQDDIDGIQSLYGRANGKTIEGTAEDTTTTTTTTPKPTTTTTTTTTTTPKPTTTTPKPTTTTTTTTPKPTTTTTTPKPTTTTTTTTPKPTTTTTQRQPTRATTTTTTPKPTTTRSALTTRSTTTTTEENSETTTGYDKSVRKYWSKWIPSDQEDYDPCATSYGRMWGRCRRGRSINGYRNKRNSASFKR